MVKHNIVGENRERMDEIASIVRSFSTAKGDICSSLSEAEVALAVLLSRVSRGNTQVAALVRGLVALASDDVVENGAHLSSPELLHFLRHAGCDETVFYLWYRKTHPEIFRCRREGCPGEIVGECPLMTCRICGKRYHIVIDGHSEISCSMCAAGTLKANAGKPICTPEIRRKAHYIPCVADPEVGGHG